MWTVLKYYRIFGTALYRNLIFNRQPVFTGFSLVNKLYNLNVFKLQKNILDMSRSLSDIYIRSLLTRFNLRKVQTYLLSTLLAFSGL